MDGDNWPTIRWADVNGDGRQDVCARLDTGLTCWLSTGTGFGTSISTAIAAA